MLCDYCGKNDGTVNIGPFWIMCAGCNKTMTERFVQEIRDEINREVVRQIYHEAMHTKEAQTDSSRLDTCSFCREREMAKTSRL